MSCLAVLKNSTLKILNPDLEANDLQNLIGSSLFVHRYISTNFHEGSISSFYVKLLKSDKQTDRQTDRETNKRRVKRHLSGGGNKYLAYTEFLGH